MSSQGPQAATVPAAPARRSRRWAIVLALPVLALTAWLVWNQWLRERPNLPALDVSSATPEVAQAIQEASNAVRDNPRSGETWGRLGMLLLAHNYKSEASACFAQAHQRDRKTVRWLYLDARTCHQLDPLRAIGFLEKAVDIDDSDAPCRLMLGELLVEQGKLGEAEHHFRSVLRDSQQRPWGHLRLAQLSLRRDRAPQALEHARQAQQEMSKVQALHVLLCEIHFRLGDGKTAELERKNALALAPLTWHDPHMQQVQKLAAHSQDATAGGQASNEIAVLEEAVRVNPQSGTARNRLARALVNLKQWDAAALVSAQALDLNPDDAVALYLLGYALSQQGKVPDAVVIYQRAIERNPLNADAHYQLGFCHYRLNAKAAAIDSLKTAVRLRPNFAEAWRELGHLYAKDNDAECLACARRAVDLAPNDPNAKKLLEDVEKRLHQSATPR